jgi:hypothetical protein
MQLLISINIKRASAKCFGTCVPSSGRTKHLILRNGIENGTHVPRNAGKAYLMFVLIKNVHLVCIISGVTISEAAKSKAWVCGHLLVGIVGSNPARGMDVFLL